MPVLTSGRIPYATTGGLLLDSDNFKLVSQNLTLPNTLNAAPYGIIYKNAVPYFHDFSLRQ